MTTEMSHKCMMLFVQSCNINGFLHCGFWRIYYLLIHTLTMQDNFKMVTVPFSKSGRYVSTLCRLVFTSDFLLGVTL